MASYSPKLGGKRGSSVETSSTRGSAAASPYWRPPPSAETAEAGFSPFVAFCFTINYILGTGFLTLPWAFVQGGVLLSTLTLVSMGIVSDRTYHAGKMPMRCVPISPSRIFFK